jgi:outer membrane lipoprotein SlyB
MKIWKIFILSALVSIVASCSSTPSRPQLYPNQTLKDKGATVSQTDIDECLKEAEAYLKTPEGEKLQKSNNAPSVGTSIGFGFGGGGTGIGLGVGVGGRDSGYRLSGEEQVRRNFTNQCLVNKGYQIVGWEN